MKEHPLLGAYRDFQKDRGIFYFLDDVLGKGKVEGGKQ